MRNREENENVAEMNAKEHIEGTHKRTKYG